MIAEKRVSAQAAEYAFTTTRDISSSLRFFLTYTNHHRITNTPLHSSTKLLEHLSRTTTTIPKTAVSKVHQPLVIKFCPPPIMPVIGFNTKNGKALPYHRTAAGIAEAEKERQAERRELKRRERKAARIPPPQPYTNFHLADDPVEYPLIERDRYAFGGDLGICVPHKDDIVFTAAQIVVHEYNQKSYHGRIDRLRVEALTKAPAICYNLDTESEIFLLVREHSFILLQLKLVRTAAARGASRTVMVRVGEKDVPLYVWLETLPEHRLANIAKLALEKQYGRWEKSGNPFRFLDLAVELQNKIFLFAIGEYIEPDPPGNSRGVGTTIITGFTDYEEYRKSPMSAGGLYSNPLPTRESPVNAALLTLNKQLAANARGVLWYETTKRMTNDFSLLRMTTWMPSKNFGFLTRVELAMSHFDYFDVFQVKMKPFDTYYYDPYDCDRARRAKGYATGLSKLTSLRYLEIYFMSTIEPTYSPWLAFHLMRPDVREWQYPDVDFRRLPCQKVMVDQIMAFAANYILAIPKLETVRLTGFIKTETKKYWEGTLNEKGAVSRKDEIKERQDAIKALPFSAFPPECFCPHTCGSFALDQVRLEELDRTGNHPELFRKEFEEVERGYFFDFDDTYTPVEPVEKNPWLTAREYVLRRSNRLRDVNYGTDHRQGP
ncbi:hypothetical protein LTR49_009592 [Elasticomyces elasticus]|nr:hypothetical protein LTR49_009592 [Elasticomyces elasticus]KAK5761508.1 hypothetical protein LTS12_008300 [Elasticomyces elasticus]